ncbi:MAG: ComF family protein [Smithellaceae bacterium]|nr:ComF family protein [Smithellaceae bacterium]
MKDLMAGLADLVFPPLCIGCASVIDGRRPLPLCPSCLDLVRRISSPLCSTCGTPFATEAGEDHLCGECAIAPPPFQLARSWARYETHVMTAIHQFKYQGKTFWGKILGQVMAEATYPGLNLADYSLVLPVPLHRRRLRERGFNQSLLLARVIASFHRLRLDFTSLRRIIHTPEQTKLGREEREKNVRRAFAVQDPRQIKGESIILVDDVFTTGSTVRECSRTLLGSQAERVAVLTAARAI